MIRAEVTRQGPRDASCQQRGVTVNIATRSLARSPLQKSLFHYLINALLLLSQYIHFPRKMKDKQTQFISSD